MQDTKDTTEALNLYNLYLPLKEDILSGKRTTIDVAFALDKANAYLELSPPEEVERRMGVASFLEVLLMEAGQYQGYGFLNEKHNDDYSRRRYYEHRLLRSTSR